MDVSQLLADLQNEAPLIAPSLLACDFAKLGREIQELQDGGARLLHLDVMDGHFVPNLSIGVPIVEAVRRSTDLVLDVHLMISNPEQYVEVFRKAGADLITVHAEVVDDLPPLLERIRELGAGAGVALSPPTPVESIEGVLDHCDLVLVMSVMPGFGGQSFDPVALDKLRRLKHLTGGKTLLSVDGGVSPETIGDCARAGARLLVIGTALLGHADYKVRIEELTVLARSHQSTRV